MGDGAASKVVKTSIVGAASPTGRIRWSYSKQSLL